MTRKVAIKLLTISTFMLKFFQLSCDDNFCLPIVFMVSVSLSDGTLPAIWGWSYLLGTFGQIYVFIKPDKMISRFVYAVCFIAHQILAFLFYLDWRKHGDGSGNEIYWWFTVMFLILGTINLEILFKKQAKKAQA